MSTIEKLKLRRSDVNTNTSPRSHTAAMTAVDKGLEGKEYGEIVICPYSSNTGETKGMVLGIKSFDGANVHFIANDDSAIYEYTAASPLVIDGNQISLDITTLKTQLGYQAKIDTVYAPIRLATDYSQSADGRKLSLSLNICDKEDNVVKVDAASGGLYVSKNDLVGGTGSAKKTEVRSTGPATIEVKPENDVEIIECIGSGTYSVTVDASKFSKGDERTVILYNDAGGGNTVSCFVDSGASKGCTIVPIPQLATSIFDNGGYVEYNFLYDGFKRMYVRWN